MRSEGRLLDSAVFQLTPTRTRCELVITANGKSEKLASGLLNPFLAHLKTAQDQIAKGGYSIRLEPDPASDAFWFTKGTLERFVRFVSTPEVLERVYTIESEILQIEDAITIQGNENLGLSTLEDPQLKSAGFNEGSKAVFDADAEKAIVLYKPGSQSNPPDSNGFAAQEENSKVQLLRVLETRKFVLQKEQGMAFARATAAGFDMDHMEYLIMFAESFGASRLKEACLRFMELWKVKHETGQWIEVEAEAMSTRSGFPPFNASGIVFTEDTRNDGDLGMESIGNGATTDPGSDKRLPLDSQMPQGQHEHFQGHFQQPAFPPWAMHPPPGPPVYQTYPMHGMPYYPNYPGSGPFYQSAYPSSEDPRINTHKRIGRRRHSMNSKDNDVDSESWEEDVDQSLSEPEKEASHGHKSHKRSGRSGKKKPGVVVIKNINYVKSKKHEKSGDESPSTSDADTEDETENSDAVERKHEKSSRSSKKNDGRKRSSGSTYDRDDMVYDKDADSGNWQAFQSFLLRAEEKMETTVDGDMFAGEKEPTTKRRQNLSEAEPILTSERDSDNIHEAKILEFDTVNGKGSRRRMVASNDELITSGEGRSLREGRLDAQFIEMEGGGGGYRRGSSDDFMIYGQGNQIKSTNSSDPLAEEGYVLPSNLKSSYIAADESFIVPVRSSSPGQLETEIRPAIDMDLEFPTSLQRKEDSSNNRDCQIRYEPDDLTMMPERVTGSEYIGYDPVDYDMEIPVQVAVKQETGDEEDVSASTKEDLKNSEKKKLKPQDAMEKRRKDALMRRGISSKSSPLTEAQKRAEKLRAYKVDLQKAKKENEEEERKRLEALKIERQKRIAARSSSNATQSPLVKDTKVGLPKKASPSSFKGSKFSEVESGSSSPLQKLNTRRSSTGSSNSQKTTGASRSIGSSNGLAKSVSSLSEAKKASNGIMPEAKATASRTKRLSDPSVGNTPHASQKSVATDQLWKQNIANGPQVKISSIVQLDKTNFDTVQNKSVTKETVQRDSGNTLQASGSFQEKQTKKNLPRVSIGDDNPVIEKNVVMLENEMITAPALRSSEGLTGTTDGAKEKAGTKSEYAAVRAQPSPIIMGEVEDPGQHKRDDQPDSYEVVDDSKNDEPQHFSKSVTENYYQAPYARATSLEDPDASDIKYSEAPSVQSEITSTYPETVKALVSDFSDSNLTEQTNELVEKPRSKESKGFRKLLKFGRKSHN
ncbi:uncharacterized protein A4U43_C04F860 [Asparagus officinalis]|uniref:COP1-interacting protein 7 n=1 Tax=Asparagus officinalis TaxID=4686 RepID=A0A5P1EXZ0_ASPOF|nr:uncharacterized protein LOC109836339 [Asparagus officinalis]ONK70724.1 uncharacterized protein A4U43_C04F860 [Asparagus officinalis]